MILASPKLIGLYDFGKPCIIGTEEDTERE